MSEDEFVVLLEHAGITEVSDDGAQEFVEKSLLLDWLAREGIELFGAAFLLRARARGGSRHDGGGGNSSPSNSSCASTSSRDDDSEQEDDGDALQLLRHESRYALAQQVVDRLVDREWLSPIEFDYDDDETEEWKATLFGIRLSTAEAYKIYINKDASELNLSASGLSLRTQELIAQQQQEDEQASGATPTETPASMTSPSQVPPQQLREQMWLECFPTCSESCRQLFFAFESADVILYATLGLNLISNGISSVPAFSRELKSMGVSAEDRTVIVGFLARAFPSE